jgi:opacity protein-like surface antigen
MRLRSYFLALLTGTALFATVPDAQAQMTFGFGGRLGINFASASLNPDVTLLQTQQGNFPLSKGGRTGFIFGGTVEMGFARMFAVEVSPTYVMKGLSFDLGGAQQGQQAAAQNVTGTIKWKINELDFPILFKVKFLQGRIRPYAFVGPNLGIVLSSNVAINVNGQDQPDVDNSSSTSGIDFALDFGGGAEFMVSRNFGIIGDVRYSLGISNLISTTTPAAQAGQQQQQQGGFFPTNETSHASGFQIQFGALFYP